MTVSSFEVRRADTCGVQVAEGASIDLSDGLVADNAIGACVQGDGYDIARLTDGVRYQGNVVNLEATSLPVPEPTDVLDIGEMP